MTIILLMLLVSIVAGYYVGKPPAFVVDYNTWRAGGSVIHKHINNIVGKGAVALENSLGFMCCLGFITKQACPNIDITYISMPSKVKDSIPFLNHPTTEIIMGLYSEETILIDTFVGTPLSLKASAINDDERIDTRTRIISLIALFKQHHINLKFINVPKSVM